MSVALCIVDPIRLSQTADPFGDGVVRQVTGGQEALRNAPARGSGNCGNSDNSKRAFVQRLGGHCQLVGKERKVPATRSQSCFATIRLQRMPRRLNRAVPPPACWKAPCRRVHVIVASDTYQSYIDPAPGFQAPLFASFIRYLRGRPIQWRNGRNCPDFTCRAGGTRIVVALAVQATSPGRCRRKNEQTNQWLAGISGESHRTRSRRASNRSKSL